MSITPPTGILDITDAIVRVSKLEFRGATGFDTILNNVARNTILLVDQNVEYVADKAWGLKLPNAWISEFEAYWDSGASGNIDFNIYNNTTSGTNGYTISMDDTTITVKYDGGSALETVSLGSTLRNDTWRKIHILFERDMISLALDGTRVLYFKDTLIRPRVYDEDSGYVVASGLSADRKVKNLRIMNGDKWMTDNSSNIAYVHGNVGIGTTQAAYTLDVAGDIRATGTLLIEGLTTTVDTQNLSIEDAIVEIGRGNDGGTSGKDVGFLFTRNNGTNTTNSNVALVYDESTDRLTFGYSDGSPTASTLAINTSKSLDVVIPSGNLGIGTDSPTAQLTLGASSGSQIAVTDKTRLLSNTHYLNYTSSTAADFEQVLLQFDTGGTSDADQSEYAGYIDVEMVAQRTTSGYTSEIFTARLNYILAWLEQSDTWQFTTFVQENKSVSADVAEAYKIFRGLPAFKYKYVDRQLQIYVSFNANWFRGYTSFTARVTSDAPTDVSMPGPDALMASGTVGTAKIGMCYGYGAKAAYVGIGTTNPTSNLHVVGDINLTSNIVMSGEVFIKAHDATSNHVAIGPGAGQTSQGTNAVAVGYLAGQTNQHDNTVVLNASGSALNTVGTGRTYIKPLRVATVASNVMTYDQTTGE